MQIISNEQLIQAALQAMHFYKEFFAIIFKAAIETIAINTQLTLTSLFGSNWNMFFASVFVIIGLLAFVYRLVRKRPLLFFGSIFDK